MNTRRGLRALTSTTLAAGFGLPVLLVAGGGTLPGGVLAGSDEVALPPTVTASPTPTQPPSAEPTTRPSPRPTARPTTAPTPRRTPSPTPKPTPTPTPTQAPTQAPEPPRDPHPSSQGLDPRCRTGRVLCVDKTTRTLRWVVDGEVRRTLDARFGGSSTPTREGEFAVFSKSRDHVSSLYDTSMPFAMFFSGGQAVHYSPDFAARGYAGASHGCVNLRDHAGAAWLFDQVAVGDRVVVWRS